MASRFDLLSDIHQRKMHWSIQVYVIRKYDVPSYDDRSVINSIDMILVDKEGSRIHSSIPKKLMSTWGPIIKEFNMYNMKNFVIMDKKPKVKATRLRWTLSFCNRTEVEEVDLPTFPLEPFSLRTIPEIFNPAAVTENELFDVVAEVVGKEDPRELTTSKGLDTKRMGIKLQDLEKNNIRCMLFGSCVDQIMPLMTEDRVEPLIVVMQFLRVNRWDGKTSIQSHFDISKVVVDATLSDIVEFRNSMVDTDTTSSVRITQMPTQSSGPGIDQLRRGQVDINTIEDAWNTTEEGKIWIAGKILSVNSGKSDWWYKSCDVCPKKVNPKEGDMWECKRCEKITKTYTIRYKVEIIAFDETTTITLLLWDNEVLSLLGVKAQTVYNSVVSTDDGYPTILDELLEKRLLFRINVKSDNICGQDTVYTVWDIYSDEDVVDRYYPKVDDTENPTLTGMTEDGESNVLGISSAVVNLQNDNDSQLSMDALERSVTSMRNKNASRVIEDAEAIVLRGKNIIVEEG